MITITYNIREALIEARFPYNPQYVTAIKQSFRKREYIKGDNGRGGHWQIIPEEGDAMRQRLEAFSNSFPDEVEIDSLVWTAIDALENMKAHNLELSRAAAFDSQALSLLFSGDLSPLQRAQVEYMFRNARGVIFNNVDAAGGLDLLPVVGVIEYALDYPVLIVCKNETRYTWGMAIRHKTRRPVYFLDDDEQRLVKEARGEANAAAVAVVNYGNLPKHQAWLSSIPWRALVIDESHHIRTTQSEQYQVLKAIEARHKFAISQTDFIARPWELLAQLELIGRLDEIGGRLAFLQKYTRTQKDLLVPYNTNILDSVLRARCFVGHHPQLGLERSRS